MFCSKCGTMLPDGAKFCASCGSPVAVPDSVYASPAVEPAASNQQLYQTPAIDPVNVPENEASSQEAFVPSFNEYSEVNSSAPVYQAPVGETPINTASPMNYNNQDSAYANNIQMQSMPYPNNAFCNGNAAPNPQPVYPDNSQTCGPLMPPARKSKAPVSIVLSIIALFMVTAIAVCCLIFCGRKSGSSNAEEALIALFDAFSNDDDDAALKVMHPLYSKTADILGDLGDLYASTRETFINDIMDYFNPKSGGFKFSDLDIQSRMTLDKSDIDSINDTISSLFNTCSASLNMLGADLGDAEDYMCDAGVKYSGTVKIGGEEYDFEAQIVKTNGSWYVATLNVSPSLLQ